MHRRRYAPTCVLVAGGIPSRSSGTVDPSRFRLSNTMARPGWYSDHPPACTCAACSGSGRVRTTTADRRGGGQPPTKVGSSLGNGGGYGRGGSTGGGGGWKWLAAIVVGVILIAIIYQAGRAPESGQPTFGGTRSANTPLARESRSDPTTTPVPTATATPVPAPNRRHLEQQLYMLGLINAEREKAGVDAVVLGDNVAAQLHAEVSLESCFLSHWGIDGLKPYMRYSLAGGHQSNAENVRAAYYCAEIPDWWYRMCAAVGDVVESVGDACTRAADW